jgi:glycosyltransferase involved in cell wall biosynthesis
MIAKQLMLRAYVRAKQKTKLWKFVTRIEEKFYRKGTFNLALANKFLSEGDTKSAEAMLSMRMPEYLRAAVHIVRANMHKNEPMAWSGHLNNYIASFDLEPISIANDPVSIDMFSAGSNKKVNDGPKVSVIIAVRNAEDTIAAAVRSILNQTWTNLEVIILDDASTDNTPKLLSQFQEVDKRIVFTPLHQSVGPYVCRNIAVKSGLVTGDYITCHDGDDWAHPQRIEQHMQLANMAGVLGHASLALCLRMSPDRAFTRIGLPRTSSPDGVAQVARVSCLLNRDFMSARLGYWDCVRFGADSELINRMEFLLGRKIQILKSLGMICLDTGTGLSSDRRYGVLTSKGLSPVRKSYKKAFEKWHSEIGNRAYLDFPTEVEPFHRDGAMIVPEQTIRDQLEVINRFVASQKVSAA